MAIHTVVILAAGENSRYPDGGARSLLPLADGRTIIRRQLDLIAKVYDKPDIVVVTGYETQRMLKSIPSNVRIVENERFTTTGQARSALLGLRVSITNTVTFLAGDLVYDELFLRHLAKDVSVTVVNKASAESEPSLNLSQGNAAHFGLGLEYKWLQGVTLTGNGLNTLRHELMRGSDRKYLFEVLDSVVDKSEIEVVLHDGCWFDVDTSKDHGAAFRVRN